MEPSENYKDPTPDTDQSFQRSGFPDWLVDKVASAVEQANKMLEYNVSLSLNRIKCMYVHVLDVSVAMKGKVPGDVIDCDEDGTLEYDDLLIDGCLTVPVSHYGDVDLMSKQILDRVTEVLVSTQKTGQCTIESWRSDQGDLY